jgi:hypothetical protein
MKKKVNLVEITSLKLLNTIHYCIQKIFFNENVLFFAIFDTVLTSRFDNKIISRIEPIFQWVLQILNRLYFILWN